MRRSLKRKVSRILSLSMALVLMGSFNPLHALAQEYEVEEDFQTGGIEISLADEYGFGEDLAIGDMEFSIPESGSIAADLGAIVKGFKAEINEDVVTLQMRAADVEDGIQAYAASRESTLSYGTVSGYLPETGAYALYNLNLSAGDYLQARLTVPNM